VDGTERAVVGLDNIIVAEETMAHSLKQWM
jgi:hypothetical protein